MSWNNVIPAELLLGVVAYAPVAEPENPAVTMPDELVTDCRISYTFEGYYGATAGSEDHPAFAKVRRLLAARGYIEIPAYTCWNGDRVLKRFRLNNFQLEPGDTFFSSGAWAVRIKLRNERRAES